MGSNWWIHRRRFLTGASTAAFSLAGCIDSSAESGRQGTTIPESSPTRTSTATATPTPTNNHTEQTTETNTPQRTSTPPEESISWDTGAGSTFDSFDHFETDWEVIHGAAEVDPDVSFGDGQSLLLDSNGDHRVQIRRTFDSPKDFSGLDFSLGSQLISTTKSSVQIRIVLKDFFDNLRFISGNIRPEVTDRWVRIDLGPLEDRGLDPTAVSQIWVDHWAGKGETKFYVDDIRTVEKPDRGYVILTFDDGHPRDYSVAFQTLRDYGYTGACFLPVNSIGTNGNPSVVEYQEMQKAGWDIGGHTIDHERLPTYSRKEQELILKKTKEELLKFGFEKGARHLRFPFSAYNSHTLDILPNYFDIGIGGIGGAKGTNLRVSDPRTIGFKVGDNYDTTKKLIDAAVDYQKLVGLTFHMRIMESESAFKELINHIRDYEGRGELSVITPSDLLDKYLNG